MSVLSILGDLANIGVTQKDLDIAIGESVEIRAAVIAKANEVQAYWKSIAPVNKTGKPHTLASGYVDEVGA